VTFLQPYGGHSGDPLRAAMEYAWRAERLKLHEDIFAHVHLNEPGSEEVGKYIESQETLELATVGIDIGSSTSHLLFAKIILEREAQSLSARYVVVRREVVWRSPIMLTPFTKDGWIDADRLGAFIERSYNDAGFAREAIDSGAVILTGEAIKKKNAKAIDELFASEAGKFVCATAGHQLEATLAAHGSGAVRLSRERNECLLHVDVGGGTTKLALIDRGKILGVAAFAVGGRLLATDEDGAWTRVDESAAIIADELGLATDPATLAQPEVRARIASRLADVALDMLTGAPLDPLGRELLLTDPLQRVREPAAITFSGGVAEYVFEREPAEFGDIAKLLAADLRAGFAKRLTIPVIDPGTGIRATVIGASSFTVQVSGKTIYVSGDDVLPLRNVPVVRLHIPAHVAEDTLSIALLQGIERLDLRPESLMALAFEWTRDPEYHDLLAVGRTIMRVMAPGARRTEPLVVLIDGDVGKTVGHLLRDELGLGSDLISIDGVDLHDLDFVDVGEMVTPPGVIPLVIKSLVFS
jgi:ethanolamine utilization protein EutA